MFVKIPFESTIPFKSNVCEVTKMSLEHDYNVNAEDILGNFYISGEYRSHELSVNVEPFNFTLPFSVTIPENLIKDSLEFNIEDFTYEILNNNSLKVNIEYSVKGEIKDDDDLFERVNESDLESELAFIDNFIDSNYETENDKEVVEEVELEEDKEEAVKEEIKDEKIDDRIDVNEEKTIMETIKNSDDTFVTYHVHIMKESETLESVCSMYSVPTSLVKDYNNIENITIGDKVLIPKLDE